ncbi:hypothetical protein RUND412_002359 [Rhizina undulata]
MDADKNSNVNSLNALFPEDAPKPARHSLRARPNISDVSTYRPSRSTTGKKFQIINKAYPADRRYGNRNRDSGKMLKDPESTRTLVHLLKSAEMAKRAEHGKKMLALRRETGSRRPLARQSSTIIIRDVGTTLLESDLSRLVPSKTHIPDFKDDHRIARVIPGRDIKSFVKIPIYYLIFNSRAAARSFYHSFDTSPPPYGTSFFPPGHRPKISILSPHDQRLHQHQNFLLNNLYAGGGAPGSCILLSISGMGGRSIHEGRLPRTEEIRTLLEEQEFELCAKDEEEGGVAVQRVVLDIKGQAGKRVVIKAKGDRNGAESKWIIRLRNSSEAHRAVRDLNGRQSWEHGGVFKAEVIY